MSCRGLSVLDGTVARMYARAVGTDPAGEPNESDALLVPSKAQVAALYAENTNIWRRDRVLIPVFYILLGFCISFPFVAQRQFLRNTLHMNPAGQGAVLGVLIQFPWFVKLLFAFLSDSVPICGLRRKPYCIIGIFMCGGAWVLLGALPRKSTVLFCALSATATLGLVVADVMVDTLVVFIVREYEQLRTDKLGSLQTTAVRTRAVCKRGRAVAARGRRRAAPRPEPCAFCPTFRRASCVGMSRIRHLRRSCDCCCRRRRRRVCYCCCRRRRRCYCCCRCRRRRRRLCVMFSGFFASSDPLWE